MRSDQYNIKDAQLLSVVALNVPTEILTLVKFLSRKQLTLYVILLVENSKRDEVIYVLYCNNCMKQGVGSTRSWKPRLLKSKVALKRKS